MAEKHVYTVPPSATDPTEARVVYFEIGREPWLVRVVTKDQLGVATNHYYREEDGAQAMIVALNKARMDLISMEKRILQRLAADGKIPPGATSGTPD